MVFDMRKHIWEISWDIANTEPTWQLITLFTSFWSLWLVLSTAGASRTEQLQPADPPPRSQFAESYIARVTTFFCSVTYDFLHIPLQPFFIFPSEITSVASPLQPLDGNATNWHSQSFANFQKIHFTLGWKPGCGRLFKKEAFFWEAKSLAHTQTTRWASAYVDMCLHVLSSLL